MKANISVKKEVDIKTVQVVAGVRYWEDATINGVEDSEGALTPLRQGDYWCPEIDIESGKIINWPQGTTADVHFKVCDDGSYYLKDAEGNNVASIQDDYVPNYLIPGEYGDYIIMQIDETGKIGNWPTHPSFQDFFKEAED